MTHPGDDATGAHSRHAQSTRGRAILVVEDDPDHVDLLRRALNAARVMNPVVVASDGAIARDYLFGVGTYEGRDVHDTPVLVLLDLKLPRIPGIDVLRRIRAHDVTRLVPVVVLTTSGQEEDLVRAYGLGANSYVRKPVDFTRFREAVAAIAAYWIIVNEPPPEGATASAA